MDAYDFALSVLIGSGFVLGVAGASFALHRFCPKLCERAGKCFDKHFFN